MDEWMNGWMDGWMDEWMDGWMYEWMSGWMNGWMDEWMDGWTDEHYIILTDLQLSVCMKLIKDIVIICLFGATSDRWWYNPNNWRDVNWIWCASSWGGGGDLGGEGGYVRTLCVRDR